MDLLQQLGTALGLGFLSGIRLYLTTLLIGAAIRFEWLHLADSYSGLNILSDWRVMTLSGTACLIEFIADKVPWVDSAWDSAHTFIRPIGAALLGAGAFSHTDPAVKAMLMILCGGIALTGHSAKSATRLAVNQSPEPFSNWALSLAGDAIVPVATWFTFQYPVAMLVIVTVLTAIAWWLSPKIFRLMRVEVTALSAVITRWFSGTGEVAGPSAALSALPGAPAKMAGHMRAIPLPYLEALRGRGYSSDGYGIHCASAGGARSFKSSIGYLAISLDGKLLFVTRRWFRYRVLELPVSSVEKIRWQSHLIADTLSFESAGKTYLFEVFRPLRAGTLPARQTAAA